MAVRQTYNPNINIASQRGWCLKYVDDAIDAPSRTPSAKAAYLNELNAGRIDTGHAPVGIWVVGFLGFSRGQYTEYGHVFLMRKRSDGSIEIHDSEVHSGARGIYNSIEELMNWLGNYGPDYLGFSYSCDGRQIAENYEEVKPTERMTAVLANARDAANISSGIFQQIDAGATVEMKGYVTNGEAIDGNSVWFVTARSGKYMSAEVFTDKSTHDLPDLTPKSAPKPEAKPETQDYSQLILDVSNNQADDIANHFNKFAGVILKAGHVGQSYGGDANKIDPKLVKFAKAAGDKLLGIYWLPYFSTDEEARMEAERFAEAQKLVNAPLLFVDLEPEFEGTKEQLKAFKNIVLQKTGKVVLEYGGNAIISKLELERIDWYPNYGTKDNYAHGALIHQFTDNGKIDGFSGNLDFSTVKISLDELKKIGQITAPKPAEQPKDEKGDNLPSGDKEKPTEPQNVPSKENKPSKERKVMIDKDITKLNELAEKNLGMAAEVSDADVAKELISGVSKRTKLIVYIVGDVLLGASAIAPQVAIAILSNEPYVKTNAISGALATAGLFLLTMFGIYKNGKSR
jgi:hypothetical protein|nr:MAG TPA: muramidase [Caudoviricetes sp.]